jgi:hypothetical protein
LSHWGVNAYKVPEHARHFAQRALLVVDVSEAHKAVAPGRARDKVLDDVCRFRGGIVGFEEGLLGGLVEGGYHEGDRGRFLAQVAEKDAEPGSFIRGVVCWVGCWVVCWVVWGVQRGI